LGTVIVGAAGAAAGTVAVVATAAVAGSVEVVGEAGVVRAAVAGRQEWGSGKSSVGVSSVLPSL
tara:strand:- start:121 stop:312 length:192 start_codon:yes stop_codon:yes gene_type:complete